MLRNSWLVLSMCCLVQAPFVLAHVSPAFAQTDPRTEAAAHFKRGVERAEQHAYAEALSEFEAAYQLVQHASVLYNIALAQVGLGRGEAATATLRRYMAEPKDTLNPAQRKAAQALLDELVAAAKKAANGAPVQPPVPTPQVQLTIIVFPYGKAWIDGQLLGDSPVTTTVVAGAHRVSGGQARADQTVDVVLEGGAARRVVLAWARQDLVQTEPAAVSGNPPVPTPP